MGNYQFWYVRVGRPISLKLILSNFELSWILVSRSVVERRILNTRNRTFGSVRVWKFLEHLSNISLFKKSSVPLRLFIIREYRLQKYIFWRSRSVQISCWFVKVTFFFRKFAWTFKYYFPSVESTLFLLSLFLITKWQFSMCVTWSLIFCSTPHDNWPVTLVRNGGSDSKRPICFHIIQTLFEVGYSRIIGLP
jgi:hypothetical protein